MLRADVRVIAATHRRLDERVREGAVREDLYYRLAVVPIALPPLRARLDDVAPLVASMLASSSSRMGRTPPHVTAADLERLARWQWPGNVRELRSVVERALVLTRGETLELPDDFDRGAVTTPEPRTFDDAQRRALQEALDACGGRVYGATGAASRLGLAPTTLQSKLRKLGLAPRRR